MCEVMCPLHVKSDFALMGGSARYVELSLCYSTFFLGLDVLMSYNGWLVVLHGTVGEIKSMYAVILSDKLLFSK